MVFTSYNNLENIVGPGYSLNDSQIIPDPGSVNPFVPGTRVEGTPRNFTAWFWPDNTPVPAGLQNVVLYPTKPENPGENSQVDHDVAHVQNAAGVLGASGAAGNEDHCGVGREPEHGSAMPPYCGRHTRESDRRVVRT